MTVTVLHHSELVVAGLSAVLAPYADRVRVLPARAAGRSRVDVALCEPTVAPARLQRGCHAERIAVYWWAGNAAAVEHALAAGADAYLSMALSADDLVAELERVAGVRRMPSWSSIQATRRSERGNVTCPAQRNRRSSASAIST